MKKRKLLLSVLLFAVMGIMSGTAISAPYLEGEATGWNQVGPNNYSGRTRAAIFDKNNDGVIYVGTVGGLYVSVNYGKNWQEIPLGDAVQNVTAIAQADNGRLYVATGEGFYEDYRGENPYGHSNQTSGSVGNGIFMQTNGMSSNWVKNFDNDAAKYQYIADNFKFEVMPNTKPESRYAFDDDWAYINTILCVDNNLYVGTKSRLKHTSDIENLNATFTNVSIDGNAKFNVSDLCVNSNKKIAVAYSGIVAAGQGTDFKVIFNASADETNMYNSLGIGRIKLAFASKNPNDLFIFASAKYSGAEYAPDINGIIYGIYRPYYTRIGGTIDENTGIENLQPNSTNWFNVTTSSMAGIAGTSLGYGMSIFVDDRSETEQIYIGGNALLSGVDYNKEGKFSFSTLTSYASTDTAGSYVGVNIHNILPMPAKINSEMNAYDSIFLLITSDMGVFRYEYDSIVGDIRFWASYGMNNLQTYKVSAAADGSIFAATQSNAIVYMNQPKNDAVQRGEKIWSINNPNYPFASNASTYDAFSNTTFSGSGVNASAIYKTSPLSRKPVLLSRPGTNLARAYGNNGDYDAIDDQTWTYGNSETQTLTNSTMADNIAFDPFNTPTAFWESFDFQSTIDSIEVSINNNTVIRGKRTVQVDNIIDNGDGTFDTIITKKDSIVNLSCRDGIEFLSGDTLIVESDNLGYPFFHVMTSDDIETIDTASAYKLGTGDTLFFKLNNFKMKVPQFVQARTLVATNIGAFICGKIMDFSRTINPNALSENSFGNLTWARIYTTGTSSSADDYSTMNNRIHAVALSPEGSYAFLAVDVYNSFNSYSHTNLVRVKGLNDVNISDDRIFVTGSNSDVSYFKRDTVATFNRQISSIVFNPKTGSMVLTFEGVVSTDANVLEAKNVWTDEINFTDISLTIDRNGKYTPKDKPVYTALYECVNSGKTASSGRIYVGSDDGIYYRENGKWVADTANVPNVAVYNLWQQTQKLPKWIYYSYTGDNADLVTFEATQNTGVIYAATYGKGILINSDFQDTNAIESTVALTEIANKDVVATLKVYPNPATDRATIAYTLDNNANVTFRMLDLNGREVSVFNSGRQAKGAHVQTIDVQRLQRGVYVIQMISGNTSKSAKLIVK